MTCVVYSRAKNVILPAPGPPAGIWIDQRPLNSPIQARRVFTCVCSWALRVVFSVCATMREEEVGKNAGCTFKANEGDETVSHGATDGSRGPSPSPAQSQGPCTAPPPQDGIMQWGSWVVFGCYVSTMWVSHPFGKLQCILLEE